MHLAKVLWAASADLPAGWPLLSHAHCFYHLFFVRSGKTIMLAGGKSYSLKQGDCIIIPPGVLHEIPAEEHSLLVSYEVKFTIEDPYLENSLNRGQPLIYEGVSYIGLSMQHIVYSWAVNDPESRDRANIFLSSMLLSVTSEQPHEQLRVSSYIDITPFPKLVKQIIQYIESNHTEPFSLEQLASEVGYNKRYLCSAFKRSTGITILDYLNHVRIRHAAQCFYYHNVPISVIAQCVGFVTPVHFTRVFKNLVGVSPSRFRSYYSLAYMDETEDERLTTTQFSVYEEVLGERILPLDDAIQALKELGQRAI